MWPTALYLVKKSKTQASGVLFRGAAATTRMPQVPRQSVEIEIATGE
jgi:hypothetical protein